MKRLFTIISILFLQVLVAQNKSATVIYKISLNTDSLQKFSNIMIKEMIEQSDSVYAKLNFNSTASTYMLDLDVSKGYIQPNLARIFGGSDGVFYYNRENQEFLHETFALEFPLIISKKPVEWIILNNETKMIDGHLCIKAIRKRAEVNDNGLAKIPELTAWFCPEIPFGFGPERFFGLPGLVLECNSNIVTFELEKITWHKDELEIKKPNLGEVIDEEEFKNRAGRF